jgi:hypothetical protein
MIDWQVQIDGRDPPGWDQHRDGCWFPDFHYQEYLLPFFDVGNATIDPYGDTEFKEADLKRLKDRLVYLQETLDAKPATRTVTEVSADQSRMIRLERQTLLAVVTKTLQMINFALASGGTIIFRGD